MAEDSAFIYELIVIEDLKEVIANWHDICRRGKHTLNELLSTFSQLKPTTT